MANIDELITKFTAVNAQLKQKSQRLTQSQQEIEQLKHQLKEANAAVTSLTQSMRAKGAELEATKTAMSETLQENETLVRERNSMQAFNAQLSAEIEGRERWIDERRTMQKEIKRLRKELNYEKTKYNARAKEAVDLTLELRKQTNESIEAREELFNLQALAKRLEVVLEERGLDELYADAVKEVQRQQTLERHLREERERQAALQQEERRLYRELREGFDLRHSDKEDDNGDENNAGLNDSAADKEKGKEKEKESKPDDGQEDQNGDLEQMLSSEIDRIVASADNPSNAAVGAQSVSKDVEAASSGRGRRGRQPTKHSTVGLPSKATADCLTKRGRGRGRASANNNSSNRITITGPAAAEGGLPSKAAAGGRRGAARGRGRGRGRGQKRKQDEEQDKERDAAELADAAMTKRRRTQTTSASGERAEKEEEEVEDKYRDVEDESFDHAEFASFLETAIEEDTDDIDKEAHPHAPPAPCSPPAAATTAAQRPHRGEVGQLEEEDIVIVTSAPPTAATSALVREGTAAETALEMVREMVGGISLPATPVTPLPSAPATPSSSSSYSSYSSRPSTPIRYSSSSSSSSAFPPPSPIRQSSFSAFPSYSAAPPSPAHPASRSPSTPSSTSQPHHVPSPISPVSPSSSSSSSPLLPSLEAASLFSESEKEEEDLLLLHSEDASPTLQAPTPISGATQAAAQVEPEVRREQERGRKEEREAEPEPEPELEQERQERVKEEEEEGEERERLRAEQEKKAAEESKRKQQQEERERKEEAKEENEQAKKMEEEKQRKEAKQKQKQKKKSEREDEVKRVAKEGAEKESEAKSTRTQQQKGNGPETRTREGEEEEEEESGALKEKKRKREEPPPSVVITVERSRRPRELQQLYFSRRMDQLSESTVEEVAEDLSEEKNMKEADLLTCLESFARKGVRGLPATAPSPRKKPKAGAAQSEKKKEEEEECTARDEEALLAELVWRVDGLRKRKQADEKAGRPKRPAEKRRGLLEQMLPRLETVLCRDEPTTTSSTASSSSISSSASVCRSDGAAETNRMMRLLLRLGHRRSSSGGEDDTRRREDEARVWRVLLHHFTASLRAWRLLMDRREQRNTGKGGEEEEEEEEEDSATPREALMLGFVAILDDVAVLWNNVMHVEVTADATPGADQQETRRRNAKRILCRLARLLLDDLISSDPREKEGAGRRWHQARSRCGWDAIGAIDEGELLVDITNYFRSLGTHRGEDACKWDEETTLVLRSMELLALYKGWEWTYQVLVNYVWPMLSASAPEDGHTSVAAALRLIGLMSKRAFGDTLAGRPPREGQGDKIEWLCNTLDMVITPPLSLDDGASIPVFSFRCQLAAVESLRDLSFTSNGGSLAVAKSWMVSLTSDQRKRVPLAIKKAFS